MSPLRPTIMVQIMNLGVAAAIQECLTGSLVDQKIEYVEVTRPCPDTAAPLVVLLGRTDALADELASTVAQGTRILAILAVQAAPQPRRLWSLAARGCEDVQLWSDASCAERIGRRLGRWLAVEDEIRSQRFQNIAFGRSACWLRAMRKLAEAAIFSDAPVLLTGETGTGKEVAARALAATLKADDSGFVVVDCATLSPNLAGSELFGHERGAFTGADRERDGAVALADGGILFLDEIGELPLDLQPYLLRVMQEGTYRRLGGNTWRQSRFRLVCATNRNLESETENGRFRADLMHRISTVCVHLPPLSERPEDVLPLAARFIREASDAREEPAFDGAVSAYLADFTSSGNVRALRQLCRRMAIGLIDRHVTIGDLVSALPRVPDGTVGPWPNDFHAAIARAVEAGVTLAAIKDSAAKEAIACALASSGGSVSEAARRLGVTPRALQMRRQKTSI